MAKGYALHVGLLRVDPARYDGWDGRLKACENDARAMEALARAAGYETELLLNEEATAAAIVGRLFALSSRAVAGDCVLVTYSGHGGQVPDVSRDEDDGLDETWCAFDRMVIDDELFAAYGRFAPGTRLLVLSDSCHSGSVVKGWLDRGVAPREAFPEPSLLARQEAHGLPRAGAAPGPAGNCPDTERLDGDLPADGSPANELAAKFLPYDQALMLYGRDQAFYDSLQYASATAKGFQGGPAIVLISGCQDNQLSYDGSRYGTFTASLLATWAEGAFKGSHRAFRDAIAAKLPAYQSPNYYTAGPPDPAFERARPFSLDGR